MSSAHDAHGGSAHPPDAPHAPDAHEVFTGEPVDTLSADEPRTPGWLPLLGLGLFVSAGVYFLVTGDRTDASAQKLAPMELTAPPPPPVAQAAHVARPGQPGQPGPAGQPGQPGQAGQPPANTLRKLTPQQMEDMRKKFDEERAKGAPPQGQAPHP